MIILIILLGVLIITALLFWRLSSPPLKSQHEANSQKVIEKINRFEKPKSNIQSIPLEKPPFIK